MDWKIIGRKELLKGVSRYVLWKIWLDKGDSLTARQKGCNLEKRIFLIWSFGLKWGILGYVQSDRWAMMWNKLPFHEHFCRIAWSITLWVKAIKELVSLRIGQLDDLDSHFLDTELFQTKILGYLLLSSFTFNLY